MLNMPILKFEKSSNYLKTQLEIQINDKQLILDIITNLGLLINSSKTEENKLEYENILNEANSYLQIISSNITSIEQLDLEITNINKELSELINEQKHSPKTKEFYIAAFSNIKHNIIVYSKKFQSIQEKLENDNKSFNDFININNVKYNFDSINVENTENNYQFTGFSVNTDVDSENSQEETDVVEEINENDIIQEIDETATIEEINENDIIQEIDETATIEEINEIDKTDSMEKDFEFQNENNFTELETQDENIQVESENQNETNQIEPIQQEDNNSLESNSNENEENSASISEEIDNKIEKLTNEFREFLTNISNNSNISLNLDNEILNTYIEQLQNNNISETESIFENESSSDSSDISENINQDANTIFENDIENSEIEYNTIDTVSEDFSNVEISDEDLADFLLDSDELSVETDNTSENTFANDVLISSDIFESETDDINDVINTEDTNNEISKIEQDDSYFPYPNLFGVNSFNETKFPVLFKHSENNQEDSDIDLENDDLDTLYEEDFEEQLDDELNVDNDNIIIDDIVNNENETTIDTSNNIIDNTIDNNIIDSKSNPDNNTQNNLENIATNVIENNSIENSENKPIDLLSTKEDNPKFNIDELLSNLNITSDETTEISNTTDTIVNDDVHIENEKIDDNILDDEFTNELTKELLEDLNLSDNEDIISPLSEDEQNKNNLLSDFMEENQNETNSFKIITNEQETPNNNIDLKIKNILEAKADNENLIISEKSQAIYLPYKISELINYMNSYPNVYSSIQDVVTQEFILPFDYFAKHPFKSRFSEAYNIIRNQEGKNVLSSTLYSLKIAKKSNLNPAIIAACRSKNELDIYIDYLDSNTLEKFKFFNIIYEVNLL